MPNDSGFDMSAFKSHLNAVYHNRPTDIEPAGLDLFDALPFHAATQLNTHDAASPVHKGQPLDTDYQSSSFHLGPQLDTRDLLERAVAAVKPTDTVKATAASKPQGAMDQTDGEPPAEAARDKMYEETLLADPTQIRKMFPALYRDVSVNHNGHIDMYEINKGLQNPLLPHPERACLVVLKSGYKQFSQVPPLTGDGTVADDRGVSDESLAILDKAVDRKISGDPLYAHEAKVGFGAGLPLGAMWGATYGGEDAKSKVIGAAICSVGLTAFFEFLATATHFNGANDRDYDQVKDDYLSFVNVFEK